MLAGTDDVMENLPYVLEVRGDRAAVPLCHRFSNVDDRE